MSKIGIISILLFTLLGSTSVFASSGMWGTGMYPAQQGCGFNPMMSDEIQGIKAEQEDLRETIKDIKDDVRRARTRSKTAERALADVKSRFQKHGLGGGAYNIIDRHISGGRSCDSYATEDCPASRKRGRVMSENEFKVDPIDELLALNGFGISTPVRNVANTKVPPSQIPRDVEDSEDDYDIVAPPKNPPQQRLPNQDDGPSVPDGGDDFDCGPSRSSTSPFSPGVWGQACQGSSVSGSFICRQGVDQGPNFNDRLCESLLRDWVERKKDADEALAKVGELEAELSRLDIEKADKQSEYKDAVKESREEYRRTLTEGGCIECMMQGQSYYQQQRKPNWLEIGGNLLLGVGSMYFGNQQQRYISDNNAKLGFPTQSYPSIGYGYPYFMNALYGAVGGGMSGGAFGCGGGMGGGFGGGGGAFGYPNGMMGGPMGGGMFNGGFGPGALGYGNMMGGGYMMGGPMGGGYMMGGQMMMPGGGYMMPGYMMGGGIGMMAGGMMPGQMMPGAMMPGYMMNAYMGGPMGGGMGMMMGGPGMMMGGGMMMPGGGMMMPGYMQPGMMMGGGIGMMGGGMMPGYMMGGSSMMPGYMMGGGIGMMMPGAMGGGMSGMMMPGYMMSGMVPGSMMSMMPGAMGGGAMMGGMDPMAMQMQQMQMQLQMQQMQTMQQMQQRRMENYMAQSRVVSGLTMELNTLYSRLQQAQMSMASGGSFGFELGVSPYGTMGQYGTSAVPYIQGGAGAVPGGIGAPTFR